MRRKGLDVHDATSPMVIKVTQKDIDKAVQADPGHCAVACAALRQKGVVDIRIGRAVALVDRGTHVERYAIDKADRPRLNVFDTDGYFAPGVYTLLPPPAGSRIGDRVGTPPGSNTRAGKARNVDRAKPIRGRVSAGMFLA